MRNAELTIKLVGIGGPVPKFPTHKEINSFVLKAKELSVKYNVNVTIELPTQKELRTAKSLVDQIGYSIEPLKVADVIINEKGKVIASRRG